MKIKSTKKTPATKVVTKKAAKAPCASKAARAVTHAVTFTVHAEKGKSVYLAGEFNDWDPTAKKMTYKARSGLYAVTLKLPAGVYQYKFVIDGTWCADPENADSVANDQGTFNSVMTVKD
jgi:1,4-alpha-glucan branching enzyme